MDTWVRVLHFLLIFGALLFLISGVDDLFIDFYFYIRREYRRWFVEPKHPRLREADLRAKPEQAIAILIPAWHEEAVIAQMLEHSLQWVDYRNYDIFIGTYPNDEATMKAVAEVQEKDPRVHRIVCPHDGPTSKADCLNWAIEGVRLYEQETSKHFEIFLVHDSEDIIHPLSLLLMNYLIPKIHMVQLPVMALELPYNMFTAGTYLDEFAEFHTKDLLVRERVARMVPSAGVGTGFSREVADLLSVNKRNQLFNVESLTEDYDFGFRLHDLHKKSILLQFKVDRTRVVPRGWFRRREALVKQEELVATREFFPRRFRDAVRQKARWTVGIVFQGWQQIGWRGDARMKYMIWRDRKALVGNMINVFGYFLVALTLLLWVVLFFCFSCHELPVLVQRGTWLWYVVLIDTGLMFNRIAQRAVAVHRVANWQQALLSIPRLVWGNIINFWAAVSAARQFAHAVVTGEPVAWCKTDHMFPTEAELRKFKRKLGDLLLENRVLSLKNLEHALAVQKETGDRLGDVLMRLGYVSETNLTAVLAAQLGMETRRIDVSSIAPGMIQLIPEAAAREHGLLVIAQENGQHVLASSEPQAAHTTDWLKDNFLKPYRLVCVGGRELLTALDQAYGAARRPRRMLGELLVEAGVITGEQLAAALEEQKRTGRKLGQVLEALGFIDPAVLEQKIREQQSWRTSGTTGS
jgi:adsorption protein B